MDWTLVLPEFLKQGSGYVLAAFIGWFTWQLYKENRQLYRDRLTEGRADTQKMADALNLAVEAQKVGTTAMVELRKVVEAAIVTRGGRR